MKLYPLNCRHDWHPCAFNSTGRYNRLRLLLLLFRSPTTFPGKQTMKLHTLIALLTLAFTLPALPQAIDCGAPTDAYFVGGTAFTDATMGPAPLNTLRFGTRFSYRVPAAPGAYQVKMRFVEPNQTLPLKRLFKVEVNGQEIGVVDLVGVVGPKPAVYTLQTQASSVAGQVVIDFTGIVGNAVVNAVDLTFIPPTTTETIRPVGQVIDLEGITTTDLTVTLRYTPTPGYPVVLAMDSSRVGYSTTRIFPTEVLRPPFNQFVVTLPDYRPFTAQDKISFLYWTSELPVSTVQIVAASYECDSGQPLPCGTIRWARFTRADGTYTEPYIVTSTNQPRFVPGPAPGGGIVQPPWFPVDWRWKLAPIP